MGLLTEVMLRTPAQRLVELTKTDQSGGLQEASVTGTVTVTSGDETVVGSGTNFLLLPPVPFVIQFSSHPNVAYVVASITDGTHLELATPYAWVTTAGASAVLPAIDYTRLEQAVFDAQQEFQLRTNYPFDDTTSNQTAANPSQLNKCFWAGVALVVACLYNQRGLPMPGSEGAAAWAEADRRLKIVLRTLGDGAFSPPVTDSGYNPSRARPGSLPDTDRARLGTVLPSDLGPSASGLPGEWSGPGGM